MVIDITQQMIGWDKDTSTFVAELSDIEQTRFEITHLCRKASPIWCLNPKTGVKVKFTRFHVDTDGEDVYGWWYHSTVNGKYLRFLFIND